MCNIPYNIISTGSTGNAVIINKFILIDCGVPFRELKPYYKDLKIVLLTHIHSDHFKKVTIKTLANNRPTLRFACGGWLAESLVACGVKPENIDVLKSDVLYGYGMCNIIPIELVHNVPCFGYKIHFPFGKVIYATDTNNLNGIVARNYDLYLIEANHKEKEIQEKIKEKQVAGQYAYEIEAARNHLSQEKCDDFIYKNIGTGGVYVYLHCHKETKNDNDSKNTEL